MTTCPYCRKPNKYAADLGFTDGPDAYHAECWWKLNRRVEESLVELRGAEVMTEDCRELTPDELASVHFQLDTLEADDVIDELLNGVNSYDMGSFDANVEAAAETLCRPSTMPEGCLAFFRVEATS